MTPDFLVLVGTEPNKNHPMIHLIRLFGAMKILFSNYTLGVRLEHSRGEDGNTDWLNKKLLFDLIICHLVMFHHVSVFEVELVGLFAVLCVWGVTVSILSFEHDSMYLCVFVRFIHPPSITLEVLLIAVH